MINIICFGNQLCSDDGVGYAVFEQLQTELAARPADEPRIQLFYAANSGQRALPLFFNCTHTIVVDALESQSFGHPGKLYCFDGDDLQSMTGTDREMHISSHMMALPQIWQLLNTVMETPPKMTVFAIEVADVTAFNQAISGKVATAVPEVTRRIIELCGQ
ncbi:hydrogenase maturation protease [Photobacterium sp.]|uniref:hydrogenase maturation protease n=1 Tax=Photobacterium sp. TaxID=660 RepID=UPI00299DB034|nr:hydrogenase maturation protease [Photobacterium sp.]MDX1303005.1 hydrogenase maturation protease [Photobacterium sp.]